MKIDHLLVMRHNVSVVETKYKAARGMADEGAPEWKVEVTRSGWIRNALLQAMDTCTQLQRHLNTGVAPILVVVINAAQGTTVVSPVDDHTSLLPVEREKGARRDRASAVDQSPIRYR